MEPRVQVEPPRNAEEQQEHRSRKSCLFTECINSVLLCGAEPSLAGQWLPAADGDGTWADRTGSGPMLMRGDIFAASHGGGAGGLRQDISLSAILLKTLVGRRDGWVKPKVLQRGFIEKVLAGV